MIEELRNYFKTHNIHELEKTPFVMNYNGSDVEISIIRYSFENGENQELCEYTNERLSEKRPLWSSKMEYIMCIFLKIDCDYIVHETSKNPILNAYGIIHPGTSLYRRMGDIFNGMICEMEDDISTNLFQKVMETI